MRFVAILGQLCEIATSQNIRSPEKYLRHFPLLRRKRCLRGHVHVIPPTPLIKVASDAKPYYKLQPTTLNGGEGGVVYFINDMYYWRRIFVRRAAFQSKSLNNFATSCLSAFTLYGHCVSLSIHFKCFLPLVRCL